MESLLTGEQLRDVKYSDSITRLSVLKIMRENGILRPEISLRKRQVVPQKERIFYEFSSGGHNPN